MQRYSAGSYEIIEDDDGEYYLADEVDTAMQAKDDRIAELEAAATNAKMYLESGFINCPRCAEEVATKDTDAEYALRDALAALQSEVSHDRT